MSNSPKINRGKLDKKSFELLFRENFAALAGFALKYVKELAQKGMLFTKAYAPSASCNPSRTAILTGMRPFTTGVYAMYETAYEYGFY